MIDGSHADQDGHAAHSSETIKPKSGALARPFADFVHDLTFDDLPQGVVQHARGCLLDLLGVAAGGVRTELSATIRRHATRHFAAAPDGPRARLLFDGRAVSPAGAALAGGMTIDALDAHDGHRLTKGHVGCGVLPALLALSEAESRMDGRAFLTALVVGYEIGTRAGIALHRSAADYHTSGAWVAVACAALGARVLGLDRTATREAIGIAEYHGPRSQMMRCIDHPTMLKDGSGWGAMAGVSAAYLAADGFTGAPAVTVESTALADLWFDLGTRWRLFEQYFKPWPVCRWAQPAVEAVLALREADGLAGSDVTRIEIATFHEARRLGTALPESTEEAQYSLPFAVAAALSRGVLGPGEVAPSTLGDPEIRRLAGSTVVVEDDGFSSAFPARRFARVALVLGDGRRLESGPTEARGDPENPLSDREMRAKFHHYAAPVLGAVRAEAIERAVDELGDDVDLADLIALICRKTASGVVHRRRRLDAA